MERRIIAVPAFCIRDPFLAANKLVQDSIFLIDLISTTTDFLPFYQMRFW